MRQISPAEALNKAAAYCSLCERCINEVRKKLTAWGIASIEQNKIIERLITEKFIDEERYCRAFVNDKIRFNHWGKIKITAALREKQIDKKYISSAIDNIDENEYMQILRDILITKQKEYKGKEDFATKQKLIRFAASRGFEPTKILQIIKCDDYEMDF